MASLFDEFKVVYRCQNCRQALRAPVANLGIQSRCPKCGGNCRVPISSAVTSLPNLLRGVKPAAGRSLELTRREFVRIGSSRTTWLVGAAAAGLVGYEAYRKKQEWKWTEDPRLGASLQGFRPFPASNPWNRDISYEPVDPLSDELIASIGADKPLRVEGGFSWRYGYLGMPYIVISGDQQSVPVILGIYSGESDQGPYRIPLNAPIEGQGRGDGHVIAIDLDNLMLYELFHAKCVGDRWHADSGAIYDLTSNKQRPAGWTSADAAGLPIFPGLLRYDEVTELGRIEHALRFTCKYTRKAYVPPARHSASRQTSRTLPPMGMRVRLKADFNTTGFSPHMQIVLEGLKRYGMILADNGGDWFVTAGFHRQWDADELRTLKRVKGSDFEVVRMRGLVQG